VLCVDSSDVCRRMSRRVHLEFRKIGLEHMAAPAGATSSLELPAEEIDRTRKTGTADVPTENIVSLNPEPIAGS
jgi:peptidoglycan-associated lipoprotein